MSTTSGKYRSSKEYYLTFNELVTAARYRGTVTYQEIALLVGLPLRGSYMGSEIGHLLGDISDDEVTNGRPMLSAVASPSMFKENLVQGFMHLLEILAKFSMIRGMEDLISGNLNSTTSTWFGKLLFPKNESGQF